MTAKNRAAILAEIDLLIDNTTKAITPAQLRAVLTTLVDSGFIKLENEIAQGNVTSLPADLNAITASIAGLSKPDKLFHNNVSQRAVATSTGLWLFTPNYESNAAAIAGGLQPGELYITAAGEVRGVYAASTATIVAPTGVDAPTGRGTLAAPYKTLAYAHARAVPGDTILMRGGTYALTVSDVLTKDGTAGLPITVGNYGTEVPILDGSALVAGYDSGWCLVLDSCSWQNIYGLEIKDAPDGGLILVGLSGNNNLTGLHVHHIGPSTIEGKGITLYGSGSNNYFLNCDAHHCTNTDYEDADGFQISTTGSGTILRWCRAWSNSDDGFDLFNIQDNTVGGLALVDGCWSWLNGYREDGVTAGGDGSGFKLGGTRGGTTGNSGGHTVRNCLAWKNRVYGFSDNGAQKAIFVYNNTGWANRNEGVSNGYNFYFQSSTADTLRNNLSAGPIGLDSVGVASSNIQTNNSWNAAIGVTVSDADFVSLVYTHMDDARGADFALPANAGFLRLAPGSDCINKGVNVGLPFNGPAPDLGAYETV